MNTKPIVAVAMFVVFVGAGITLQESHRLVDELFYYFAKIVNALVSGQCDWENLKTHAINYLLQFTINHLAYFCEPRKVIETVLTFQFSS